MAKYNDIENLYQLMACSASAIAETNVSAAIDCKGYEQAAIVVSTLTLAAGYVGTVTIEDSADGATGWATLSGASIAIADTDDDSRFYGKVKLNIPTVKRYIRLSVGVATAAGETSACLIVGNKSGEYPVETKTLTFNI
jgi:hypothetical protein